MDANTGSRVAAALPELLPHGAPLKCVFNDLQDQPDPSFLEAMAPITDEIIPQAQAMARHTYQQAIDLKTYGRFRHHLISEDHLAIIMKYCAEDTDPSVYKEANASCYKPDRSSASPFKNFLWLLLRAMYYLQPYPGTIVHRGVKKDLRNDYPAGREFTWQGFTSTTKSLHTLCQDMFLGDRGERTIFTIELTQRQARDISAYSPLDEGEVLLPPASRFRVISMLAQVDLTIVHLLELPSEEWILKLPQGVTIEVLEQQLHRTQRDRDEAQQELAAERMLAQEQLASQQAMLQQTQQDLDVSQEQLISQAALLQQTKHRLDDALQKLEEKTGSAQHQLASQAAELQQARQDLEALLQQTQHCLNDSLQKMEEKTASAQQQLASQAAELQQERQDLNEVPRTAGAEKAHAQEQLASQEPSLHQTQHRLDDKQQLKEETVTAPGLLAKQKRMHSHEHSNAFVLTITMICFLPSFLLGREFCREEDIQLPRKWSVRLLYWLLVNLLFLFFIFLPVIICERWTSMITRKTCDLDFARVVDVLFTFMLLSTCKLVDCWHIKVYIESIDPWPRGIPDARLLSIACCLLSRAPYTLLCRISMGAWDLRVVRLVDAFFSQLLVLLCFRML